MKKTSSYIFFVWVRLGSLCVAAGVACGALTGIDGSAAPLGGSQSAPDSASSPNSASGATDADDHAIASSSSASNPNMVGNNPGVATVAQGANVAVLFPASASIKAELASKRVEMTTSPLTPMGAGYSAAVIRPNPAADLAFIRDPNNFLFGFNHNYPLPTLPNGIVPISLPVTWPPDGTPAPMTTDGMGYQLSFVMRILDGIHAVRPNFPQEIISLSGSNQFTVRLSDPTGKAAFVVVDNRFTCQANQCFLNALPDDPRFYEYGVNSLYKSFLPGPVLWQYLVAKALAIHMNLYRLGSTPGMPNYNLISDRELVFAALLGQLAGYTFPSQSLTPDAFLVATKRAHANGAMVLVGSQNFLTFSADGNVIISPTALARSPGLSVYLPKVAASP